MNKLKSRKFWVTVITTIILMIGEEIGLTADTLQNILVLAASYLGAEGIGDAMARWRSRSG